MYSCSTIPCLLPSRGNIVLTIQASYQYGPPVSVHFHRATCHMNYAFHTFPFYLTVSTFHFPALFFFSHRALPHALFFSFHYSLPIHVPVFVLCFVRVFFFLSSSQSRLTPFALFLSPISYIYTTTTTTTSHCSPCLIRPLGCEGDPE